MSALFSALCLACAAFARSTKEGQYYLMPILLVSMPLMMLPMAPGTELNLGNSLIPITGMVLLVISLVQGDFAEALRYFVPVCGVTLMCCHLAIRWAVYQFNQESVLFRESERLDPRRWILHLIRDRQDTPSLAEAILLRRADFRDSVLYADWRWRPTCRPTRTSVTWRHCYSSAKWCASRCRRCSWR